MGNPYLNISYKIMFFIPIPKAYSFVFYVNITGTMKLVKIPLIDSILLQLLKQKFCQINKRGGPNKVQGVGKISEN